MRFNDSVFRSTIIKLRNINSRVMPNNKILLYLFLSLYASILLPSILNGHVSAVMDQIVIANSTFSSNMSVTPTLLNTTYIIPELGLRISLPHGWTGIDHDNFVMISPAGMNPRTGILGHSGDKVVMTFEVLNFSQNKDKVNYNNIQDSDCTALYIKNVNINGFDGKETFRYCGHMKEEKINNYEFTIGNTLLIVGFKGSGSTFDDNLKIFKKSVNTITRK